MVSIKAKKASLLLATALTGVVIAVEEPVVYTVLFTDECDTTSFFNVVKDHSGTVLEQFDNDAWQGASIQFESLEIGETAAIELQEDACVDDWDRALEFTVPLEHAKVVSAPVEGQGQGDVEGDEDREEEEEEEEEEDGEGGRKLMTRSRRARSKPYVPHAMSQVDQLHAVNITGEGIKVAVVDTGIDYNHPALGNGCFGSGCLVDMGYDFVGDDFKSGDPQTKVVPDSDPMDCDGHGTHVAGIIAAQPGNAVTGAAPGVKLRAYRVLSCHGSSRFDIILAGLNRAYKDKADIISMSLGGNGDYVPNSFHKAISKIIKKGVPVLLAAGNDGANGMLYMTTYSRVKGATMISAFLNHVEYEELYRIQYTIDDGLSRREAAFFGEPSNWDNVTLPIWSNDAVQPALNACEPLPDDTPDLGDYIVFFTPDDNCDPGSAVPNFAAKGAKYIIMGPSTSRKEFLPFVFLADFPELLGAASVSYDLAQFWLKQLRKGRNVVVNMPDATSATVVYRPYAHPAAGSLLEQTSWGPTIDMQVKPHFGAAGGQILSTYPLHSGKYAISSGTSMATPLVAAAYALIFQARGKMSPSDIERLVSNTAEPSLFHNGTDFVIEPVARPAPVAQQGAGLVKAFVAAYATTAIEPASISFNDTDHHVGSATVTIINSGNETITYKISHHPSLTMYMLGPDAVQPMPFPNEIIFDVTAVVQAQPNQVTLAPGETAQVEVSAVAPTSSQADPARLPYYSGFLFFDQSDGSSMTVPYHGVAGSLREATVLISDGTWIASRAGAGPAADNTTFTISQQTRDGLPVLNMRLAMDSTLVHVFAVPADINQVGSGNVTEVLGLQTVGEVSAYPVQGRQRLNHYRQSWDGRLASGRRAPAGTYKLVTMALRIFGNAKNKDDFDVSETSWFSMDYA